MGTAACVRCKSELSTSGRCAHCGAAGRVGSYRVVRVLSEHPHGRVYAALGPGGRRVALKEVSFALVPNVKMLEAFERESALLRQLDHPAVPKLIESFTVGEGPETRFYIASEWVEGMPLDLWLEEHRLSEDEARAVARDVLGVLVYLHALSPPVVHRDLKPGNVIRRPDGTFAVVDFGSARDALLEGFGDTTFSGTVGYMPPEQLAGAVDPPVDLHALGATLLHLLSRRAPWEYAREGRPLQPGPDVNVSAAMRRFLEGLLATDRRERFTTAQAALDALERPEAPRRRWRWAATGGAAAAAAGAAAWLLWLHPPAWIAGLKPEASAGQALGEVAPTAPARVQEILCPTGTRAWSRPESSEAWCEKKGEDGTFLKHGLQKVGPWTTWHDNGRKASDQTYDERGQVHGPVREWHRNGRRKRVARYDHGRPRGVERSWTDAGALLQMVNHPK